jgi:hypothetical protein
MTYMAVSPMYPHPLRRSYANESDVRWWSSLIFDDGKNNRSLLPSRGIFVDDAADDADVVARPLPLLITASSTAMMGFVV